MFFKKNNVTKNKSKNEESKISNETLKQLARTNVKNSYRDYIIYFITLTFGICLLYTFNTIDKQFSLFGDNFLLESYLDTAAGLIFGASIIISIIFAFLVNYANQFLMRRRKKEFGIYITLGMNKRDITKLMYKESITIGILALIVGVGIGIFAEQGISILTTKMLGLNSLDFRFSISILALIKTGILFIVVLWFINKFNKKTIEKYTLIELIKADKKNEFVELRNFKINLIMFIGSVVLILCGYLVLLRDTFSFKVFGFSIALVCVGTYLFFKSLSDFLIKVLTKRKSKYFKNINMFKIAQISSRIKSMNVTMTIICSLLFLAMTIIPSGISISEIIINDVETATPYHATISNHIYEYDSNGKKIKSIKEELVSKGFPFSSLVLKYSEVKQYSPKDLTISKLNIGNYINDKNISKNIDLNEQIYLVGLTDYNQARVQQGLEKVSLNYDEYLLNSVDKNYKYIYETYLSKESNAIDINGVTLKDGTDKIQDVNYQNSTLLSNIVTIVVPDKVISNLEPTSIFLNVNYPSLTNEYDNEFVDNFLKYKEEGYRYNSKIVIDGEKVSMNTILSYISLYIGIIFLITAGAVLALQQLVDQDLNIERYNLLKKLGVSEKQRENALFTQILVVFLVPFSVAFIHSLFVNGVIYYIMGELLTISIIKNLILTIGIVALIYGTYFVISYNDNKNTIID